MSDIVERMRNYIHGEPAHWEAVPEVLDEAMAEIESLRLQLANAITMLRESLTENTWNAYYCGVTKEGGKWMDGGRSEGEWLRRELGLSDGWHDCAMIQARIPEVVEKQIATLKERRS